MKRIIFIISLMFGIFCILGGCTRYNNSNKINFCRDGVKAIEITDLRGSSPYFMKVINNPEQISFIFDALMSLKLNEKNVPVSDTCLKFIIIYNNQLEKTILYDNGVLTIDNEQYSVVDNKGNMDILFDKFDTEKMHVDKNGEIITSSSNNNTQNIINSSSTNSSNGTTSSTSSEAPLGSPENPYAIEPYDPEPADLQESSSHSSSQTSSLPDDEPVDP